MKKNIHLLVHQINSLVAPSAKKSVRFKGSDVSKVTNKILVDQKAKTPLTPAEQYIIEEMKDYEGVRRNQQVEKLEKNIRSKSENKVNLDKQLTKLEMKFSLLMLQDVMGLVRLAHKAELTRIREKLRKLESSLAFKLQSEELQPHLQESLNEFARELNEIINKTNKIH